MNSSNMNSHSSPRLHSPTLGKQSPTITSTSTNTATNTTTTTNNNTHTTATPVVVVVAVVVPYTVWITEAWRVLGWAEPSAALFWEMATMYAALIVSQREISMHYYYYNNNDIHHHHSQNMNHHSQTHSNHYYYPRGIIPPILSCGSTGSVGSHGTSAERTPTHTGTGGGSTGSSHHNTPYHNHNHHNNENHSKKHNHTSVSTSSRLPNAVASAKELPVWLVSTFLLLHCEEGALQRNLSGPMTPNTLSSLFQPPPPRQHHLSSETTHVASTSSPLRFGTSTTTSTSTSNASTSTTTTNSLEINTTRAGKMDFSTLFQYPSALSRYVVICVSRNDGHWLLLLLLCGGCVCVLLSS